MKKQIDKDKLQIKIAESKTETEDSTPRIKATEKSVPVKESFSFSSENNQEDVLIETPDESSTGLTDKLQHERERRMRIMAEYDNYRRRTQAEYAQVVTRAAERIITSLLPILDDFTRLMNQDQSQSECKDVLKGAELIYRKLDDALKLEGLLPIETVGEPYNAEIHEAVAEIEDPSKPPGTVLTEVVKGYMLGEMIGGAGSIIGFPGSSKVSRLLCLPSKFLLSLGTFPQYLGDHVPTLDFNGELIQQRVKLPMSCFTCCSNYIVKYPLLIVLAQFRSHLRLPPISYSMHYFHFTVNLSSTEPLACKRLPQKTIFSTRRHQYSQSNAPSIHLFTSFVLNLACMSRYSSTVIILRFTQSCPPARIFHLLFYT